MTAQDSRFAPGGQKTGELRLEHVSKRFDRIEAVRNVTLEAEAGTILSLLGPSGCGKTTILRMVAGFLRPSDGRVLIDKVDVTDLETHRRNVGMVFQTYALFPHKTVAENVAFGLLMRGIAKPESRDRVREALAIVRMSGLEDRYPAQLSGGQQQRVSLARAIIVRPRILLLDEPFGALDRLMRENMQIEVKQLQRQLGITFLFVTHDQEEALTLSDRIAVLKDGVIQQLGEPSGIYERPENLFVAEFFGDLNKFSGRSLGRSDVGHIVETEYGRWIIPTPRSIQGDCVVAVRARDVEVVEHDSSEMSVTIPGCVRDIIYKGNSTLLQVMSDRGDLVFVVSNARNLGPFKLGQQIHFGWRANRVQLYPATDVRTELG